jgi:hypothetical protein
MSALVICTTKGTCLPVMAASVSFYLPEFYTVYLCGSDMVFPRHRTINLQNNFKTFGDAYNYAVGEAFKDHNDVIVANDDVVLTPHTHETLMEDLRVIPEDNRGWVGARADYARGMQNVRFRHNGDGNTVRHASESLIVEVDVIAPYFAYISRDAWVDFPPLNWFSDDIQCIDMAKKGFKHYISRAYVHHVGSQTCGLDYQKCMEEARPWIEENRPELPWFKKS